MNRIKLTESQLNDIIRESIMNILNEDEELEEGWFGDKWNQTKAAASTVMQKQQDDMTLKDRFSAAKKNWNAQGELNGLNDIVQKLSQFVDNRQLDPQTTIAELIGGKYRNGQFGKLSGKLNSLKGNIARRGGKFY